VNARGRARRAATEVTGAIRSGERIAEEAKGTTTSVSKSDGAGHDPGGGNFVDLTVRIPG